MLAYLTRRLLLAASTVAAVSFGAFVAFGLSFDPSGPLAAAPTRRPTVRGRSCRTTTT